MAKSLGQIHTCNFEVQPIDGDGEKWLLDTAGVLSNQLNHMVRQGNYMKVVGIDMTVSEFGGVADAGGQVSGYLNYYAPTRGRCEAFKSAFAAVREGARLQGVRLTDNQNYDFRVPLGLQTDYINAVDIKNVATIDGTNVLALYNATVPEASVFDVYNSNIQPSQAGALPVFSGGYGIPGTGGTVGTDFVLNEGAIFDPAMHNVASIALERIPFQLSFTPGTTDIAVQFQWRPDPALYLAVMTGQFELVVDELDRDGGANDLVIEVAIHVAGWKSIMGNPDKKRRKGTRHKKAHSSKRRK